MKIGILADCFGLSVNAGLEKAAALGADGVQLYAVSGPLAPENMTKQDRIDLKKKVDDLGLTISAICGDLGEGGFAFPEANPGKIEQTKKIVDLANDLGCHIITTHIGVVPHDVDHPRFAIIAEALKELGAYAQARNSVFAIETGPEPSEDLKRMLIAVNNKGVGVNFDPANLVMCHDETPVHAVHNLKDYIVHTHAKDGILLKHYDMDIMYGMVPAPDDYNEYDYCIEVPLGEGMVHFDTYIPALREIGYDGYLTIERECGDDPARDITLAMDFLRKYI